MTRMSEQLSCLRTLVDSVGSLPFCIKKLLQLFLHQKAPPSSGQDHAIALPSFMLIKRSY